MPGDPAAVVAARTAAAINVVPLYGPGTAAVDVVDPTQVNILTPDLFISNTDGTSIEFNGQEIILPNGPTVLLEEFDVNGNVFRFVDLATPSNCLGKSTVESIQSGLYFSHLGLLREAVARLGDEAFEGRTPVVLITGGHARFFKDEPLVTAYVPDLVLHGLCRAVELNRLKPELQPTDDRLKAELQP